jgi:hypothetical protein
MGSRSELGRKWLHDRILLEPGIILMHTSHQMHTVVMHLIYISITIRLQQILMLNLL